MTILHKHGKAWPADSGQFVVDRIWVSLDSMEIPEGDYSLIVFMSDDTLSVGDMKSRRTLTRTTPISIAYQSNPSSLCLLAIQGDSLYFIAEKDLVFGDWNLTLSTTAPGYDQGFAFTALLNGNTVDTDYFVPLDSNGLFFPLKVTDNNNGYSWVIRAVNNQDPSIVAQADVVIRKPASLGSTYNGYDDEISYWANVHAVPVAILKAQIDKESLKINGEFDTSSYRYEPCFDKTLISYNSGSFNPSALLFSPYNLYNLQVPAHLAFGPIPRGSTLVDLDTMAAVELYGNNVSDLNSDGYLSAAEYLNTLPGQNWNCTVLPGADFVAQTTIASSYGLTQVLWSTAVSPMRWNDGAGGNPHSLFSPNEILDLGAGYLRRMYDDSTTGNWYEDWRTALGKYNGGQNNPNFNYADDILSNRVYLFQPN